MAGDVGARRAAGGCAGAAPRRDLPPEQTAELAKQRKRDANARHRARKKAMAGLEEAMALVQLDAEKLRGAELAAAHAAMNALKEYQEEALRVLQFASLTENVDGEVALVDGHDFAALDSSHMAALLAAAQQRAAAQRAQRQGSSDSEGSQAADAASGAQSSRAGAAAPRQAQQAAALAEPALASAAASACSGGPTLGSGAAGASHAASAAAASTAAVPPGQPEPSQSGKSQAGAAGPAAASGSQSAGDGDATSTQEQRVFVSQWLTQIDGITRNWQATQVPEVRSTFVRVAAAALNFMSTQMISQRNREFTVQLQHMVQRWEACPGSRREIEEQIAGRIATRQAVIQYLVNHRVPVLMELWLANCCPPAAPGTPSLDGRPAIHHVLLPIAQYLQANLTADQLKELEAAWSSYQRSTDAARQQRTSAAVQLQYAAALQSISWQKQSTQPSGGCTAERSQAYNAMAEGTGCLSTLGHSEMAAIVELQEALIRVLTPVQMARVFLTSFPYNPDMTQICKWLFGKPAAAALPAASGRVPAGAPLQAAAAAAPAPSSEASRGVPLPGAPLPGAPLPPGVPPPPLAPDAFEALGLLPEDGTDAFMDLLSDGELDMLIADLAGGCNDSGHLLASSSPRLP